MNKNVSVIVIGTIFILGLTCAAFAAKSPWEGTTVTWLTGTGHNAVAATVAKRIAEEELGINVKLELVPGGNHREFVLRDWKTGGGAYDMVTMFPRYNAEMMGLGYFTPLNDYLDKYNAWDNYESIIPTTRKLYCEWDEKVYAFVQDGDITMMYYRKDGFSNPTHQAQFKAKYGYELKAPDTVDQLLDVCEFFNGWDWDNDGAKEYGFMWTFWRKEYLEGDFLPLFGDYGGIPFDENMNPLVNTEAGVKALELMKKLMALSLPGALGMNVDECFAAFLNGEIAVGLYYPDVARMTYSEEAYAGAGGPHWAGKIGYAVWPKAVYKGVERRFANMCHGRVIGISKFSKVKDAAFQVLKLVNRLDIANEIVINPKSGSDAYLTAQLDPKLWKEVGYRIDDDALKFQLASMKYGYPELMIPGNEEYYDSLRTQCDAYLAGTIDSAQAALDKVAEEWDQITNRWGRAKQKAVWEAVIKKYEAIGLQLPK